MNRHGDKFDDSVFFDGFRHSMSLPAIGSRAKVRAPGATREVRARIVTQLDEMWATLVAPQTGWRDHDAFVDDIALGPGPFPT
ncbi:MAG: hypothetical protein GC156_09090 [Actinomycetales bacterium]|nr:hypothetical protein [Actinomycetales bacterium]